MASSDSERKPDDKERGAKIGGTTSDWARVILTYGTVMFAVAAVATAIGNQYFSIIYPLLFAALAALSGYLVYHIGRKRRRPAGQDFNF
jgi:hypothetical protein